MFNNLSETTEQVACTNTKTYDFYAEYEKFKNSKNKDVLWKRIDKFLQAIKKKIIIEVSEQRAYSQEQMSELYKLVNVAYEKYKQCIKDNGFFSAFPEDIEQFDDYDECVEFMKKENAQAYDLFDDNETQHVEAFWAGLCSLSYFVFFENETETDTTIDTTLEEIKTELAEIIGLQKVKDFCYDLEKTLEVQKLREEQGEKVANISRHMIFIGNPGTGKTTIARIIAKFFKAVGLLSSGHLCEVSRVDLVAQYVGQTAIKTTEVIDKAMGGVLFIDEAYSLCRGSNDNYGIEAVDTLVKAVEDYRDDLVVILAGYKDEMSEFLKNNPGLKSRFPNIVNFEDYTAEEMLEIGKSVASSSGYSISDDCNDGLLESFSKTQIVGKSDSGNGRFVRNLIEKAIIAQSKRIVASKSNSTSKEEFNLLCEDDFMLDKTTEFNLENELSGVVGLTRVKDYIRSLEARLRVQKERQKHGLAVETSQSLHMIFKGNPGTGKTMVARMIADMLCNLGITATNVLVEVSRAELVSHIYGETAIKTREKVTQAFGGVLFVDEAYSLLNDGGSGYGKEAIDTLVKLMDDNRERLVVIIAGYNRDMEDFIKVNPGLKSRFPNIIDFADYNVQELMEIATNIYSSRGYVLSADALEKLYEVVQKAVIIEDFGNGRFVRNVFEKSLNRQSLRLAKSATLTKGDLITIVADDVE